MHSKDLVLWDHQHGIFKVIAQLAICSLGGKWCQNMSSVFSAGVRTRTEIWNAPITVTSTDMQSSQSVTAPISESIHYQPTTHRLPSQQTNQFFSQSASQPISWLVIQFVSQKISHHAGQSNNQLVRQSFSCFPSHLVSQSVSQSVSWSVSQSIGQSVSWSVSQLVSQSVSQSVGRQVGRPNNQLVS